MITKDEINKIAESIAKKLEKARLRDEAEKDEHCRQITINFMTDVLPSLSDLTVQEKLSLRSLARSLQHPLLQQFEAAISQE